MNWAFIEAKLFTFKILVKPQDFVVEHYMNIIHIAWDCKFNIFTRNVEITYLQENNCIGVSLVESCFKVLYWKETSTQIPVNIVKFLRVDLVIEHRWLVSSWPYYILWLIIELIAFSSCARVSSACFCCNKFATTNKHKKENDKQKCPLIAIFFYFCFWKHILHSCWCSLTITVIFRVAHKLN